MKMVKLLMEIKLLQCLQEDGNIKKFKKGGVVGTLMSNYGLEKFLKKEKIKFLDLKLEIGM